MKLWKLDGFGEGIAKGLALTFKHLFRRPFTVQYPEERLPLPQRFRGFEFIWYQDRCTGCSTCAKACPDGIITIETHPEGERYMVDRFEVDTGRCMFCGLCVEACPFDALYLGTDFERARYRRRDLVTGIPQLSPKDKKPSSYARPQLEPHGGKG